MASKKKQQQLKPAEAVAPQEVLNAVGVAWHTLAPELVAIAERCGNAEFVWAEARALFAGAMQLPEAHHKCVGIGCKYGYAHAAGF